MKSKTVAILIIIALCLSLASALAPPLASPAHASPMQTLNLTFSLTIDAGYPPPGNFRSLNLQPGDEVIQFTRPNLVVGSNAWGNIGTTLDSKISTVTGDLSGTMSGEFQTVIVGWDELVGVIHKGYVISKNTFDDGEGNTFSGVVVMDMDTESDSNILQTDATGYFVSTSGTGIFSGQVLIGTASWTITYNTSTGIQTTTGTMTLRRYSSSEVSGPYAMSTTGTSINGNSRDMGGSTGTEPNDEFLQSSRANIIIPKGDPAGYIEGGSSSGSITSGILTGTMTQTYNHIFIPGTTPPYQGLSIAKVTGSNASGSISGIGVYDALGISGGSLVSYGYMFALRENGTGAYADKDFYATGAITDTAGTWTGNANLYIMEPQVAGSTVSGTFTVTNGTISGTYNTSPPYETLTGSGTGTFSFSGDISGTSTFEGTYDASDQSMRGTNIPAPCTLTIGGVTHTAMIYGKSTTTNFVIGPPGHPNPSPVTFDMLISGDIWTTDGSNIFVHATVSGSGNATETWPALGQWQMTGFSVSGTWTGTAQNFESAPQVSDVTPGSGTVTLSGALGTVAQLNYETTGSGTILLAQYEGNPGGNPVKTPLGKYIEVDTSIINPEITWPVELRVYYTDAEVAAAGIDESTMRMYRWDGSSWAVVADSGVNPTDNYVWANLTSFSTYAPMGDPTATPEIVTFPDPNLETAIREAIGKPAGDIYQSDLNLLTRLDAGNRSIVELTGLEHCTSLTFLYLQENYIADVTPLSNLTHLGSDGIGGLDLSHNQIADITALGNLSNLQWLDVSYNQITDISPLTNLTSLRLNLGLMFNQISDVSPLGNLTNLQQLLLVGNNVSDISALSGLTNLRHLLLGYNRISDISALANLTNLGDESWEHQWGVSSVFLRSNQISDIGPLISSGLSQGESVDLRENPLSAASVNNYIPQLEARGVTVLYDEVVTFPDPNLAAAIRQAIEKPAGDIYQSDLDGLTTLIAENRGIVDLTGMEYCINLRYLILSENQISDISPLAGLTNLTSLGLSYNQISDISPLAGLTNLTNLYLYNNQISDISPLAGLTNLTSLYLDNNQISDISPLAGLNNLTYLELLENQISDISPLAGLSNLTCLLLPGNQISDISPLAGLTNLTNLDLYENQINDISPLTGLTNLSLLDLCQNQISDASPLVSNSGLGMSDSVYLSGNPLSSTSIYEYIPQLRDRGVSVDWQWGPPTISSVSPSSGIQGQTLSPTITGTYLTGATTVSFGSGITVNSFTVNSSTRITGNITISGSATTGARDVSVNTPGGTATKTEGFTVNQAPPTIDTVNPSSGIQGQTLPVTITGTYLTGATSVSFGSGITVNSFTVDSSTQITADITISGSAPTGASDVSVTAPGGTATKTGGFTVNQASQGDAYEPDNTPADAKLITTDGIAQSRTISPAGDVDYVKFSATPGVMYTIRTSNLGTNCDTYIYLYDTDEATMIAYDDDSGGSLASKIEWVPTISGTYYVKVRHYNSSIGTGSYDINVTTGVPSPTLTWVSPSQGYQGQSLSVTITGTCLTGSTSVSLGSGITVDSFTVNSLTQITASITISGTATPGTRDISVTTAYGTVTLAGGFTVIQASQPDAYEPDNTPADAKLITTDGIAQSRTISPAGDVDYVKFSATPGVMYTIRTSNLGTNCDTYIYLYDTDGATMIAYDDDGGGSLASKIEWVPTISGTYYVKVRHYNTTGMGSYDIGVTTGVPSSTITWVNPNQGYQGQSLSVTIAGTNLTGATSVSFGSGITVNSLTVDSSTQIITSITISNSAVMGDRDVSVTTPGGTATLIYGFWVDEVQDLPPNQPNNISPSNGATDVTLTPTLQSSTFSDPDSGDTHIASEWQVTMTPGDYSSPAFQSGLDSTNLTTWAPGAFGPSDTYYWHVRHQDEHGAWSSYSNETSFTTVSSTPVSGTICAAGNGTYIQNVVTQQYLSGTTELDMAFTGLMHGNMSMTVPVPFWTLPQSIGFMDGNFTVNGVDHPARMYGPTEVRDYVSSGQPPNGPWDWSFTMGSFGHPTLAWTTDGSNILAHVESTIYVQGTTYNIGGTYPNIEFSIDFSMNGTWSAELSYLSVPVQATPINAGAGTVELTDTSGAIASVNYATSSPGIIALAQYEGNPGGSPLKTPLGKFVEVNTNIISSQITWPVELRVYYADAEVTAAGIDESTMRMYRWDGSNWVLVTDSGVNTAENYVWAHLASFSPCAPMGDPASTPTPTPSPGSTLHLTFGPPTFTQNGNWRPITLQAGDEIIQFSRPNLVVGTNPTGIFSTVGQTSNVVTGDLVGTITMDTNVLTVGWDELPSGIRKGYTINRLTFDDGQGNTFSGIAVGDLDMTSGAPYPSASGYFVSTSGTGTFSGQVLIGAGSADTNGVSTMTLRRYSGSEISGPYVFNSTSTVSGPPNARSLGPSTGPQPTDDLIQFSGPNISIPKGDPAIYLPGPHSSGLVTGDFIGTIADRWNVIWTAPAPPIPPGWGAGIFNYSDSNGTIKGLRLRDLTGNNTGHGYMFALSENATGAYADKDYYGTCTETEMSETNSFQGNMYALTPSGQPPTPTPTPTPPPPPAQILHLSHAASGPLVDIPNMRTHNLQPGDEVIQFTRANFVVGSNAFGWITTIGPTQTVAVSGDLNGIMTVESNGLTVWDESVGHSRGYVVGKFTLSFGGGNNFGGVMVQDTDMTGAPPGSSTTTATGYMISTWGTGSFSGQTLIGTCTGTSSYDSGTGTVSSSGAATLRRYSSSEISGPADISGSGTTSQGAARSLGPAIWGGHPIDDFVQFTRFKINIPANDSIYYIPTSHSNNSVTGEFNGTLTNSGNGIIIPGTNPPYQGWNAGKFTYSDSSGAISGVVIVDTYGGTLPSNEGQGYMFALTESGTTGQYAGKEYYIPFSFTSSQAGTQSFNGSLYTLTPGGQLPIPPTLTTNQATNVFSTSAILRGNLDTLGTASSVDISFQWATDDYYTVNGNYTDETSPLWPMPSTGAFGFSLTGLSTDTTYHFRAKAVGDGAAYGDDLTFTTAGAGGDGDGVPANVEDAAPNNGDGNYDGIPDSQQANVASLPNAANGEYATIESPGPLSLTNVAAVNVNSLPSEGKPSLVFPYGLFAFEILATPPYGTVWVTLTFENPVPAGSEYWKYGPTSDNPSSHWYQIPMSSNDGDNVIEIPLVDGGLGDDDLTANTIIIDQGGPGWPPPPGGGGASGVPVFPNIYIGIAAALGAGAVGYLLRRRVIHRQ